MKKTIITTSIIVLLSSVALIIFVRLTSGNRIKEVSFAEAKKGTFEISVSGAGELVAENSIDIKGPNIVQNRNFRASAIKIIDLVPEGTEVRKGDYIATLDKSAFNNTLKDEQDILKTKETDLEMKILDTAVVLSTSRDDIKNQHFVVQEARITLDQSKYEPPATQRLAALELDKSQRLLIQQNKIYKLRLKQILSEIRLLKSLAGNQRRKVNDLQNILAAFTITAPADGMIIYKKDRMGNKIKAGSILNPFDPVVATLPDLSSMLSKLYVSEIEVNKVRTGQAVLMTIDAFQGRSFTGSVASIANIGEQLSNSDSKVFEVMVKVKEPDPMLRPSMTTSNKVITKVIYDAVYVPAESVQAGVDSIPFVYTKDGKKQIIIPGESNEKNIVIEQGLDAGTRIWLTTPKNPGKYSVAGNDLVRIIKERNRARKLDNESIIKVKKLITQSDTTLSRIFSNR